MYVELTKTNKDMFKRQIRTCPREGGDNGLFITLVPKVLYDCFLILWLNNFGDFYLILISWIIQLSVQTFQSLIVIYGRGNTVYHQFIGHCLIPLYPCYSLLGGGEPQLLTRLKKYRNQIKINRGIKG